MRPSTLGPYLVIAFILTIVVLTGPLLQGLIQNHENNNPIAGGSADVTIVEPPTADGVSLKKGAYGSNRYILRAPPLVVDVANVSGRPMLTYKVEATYLGFSRSEIMFLSSDTTGRQKIKFSEKTFASSRVQNGSYVVELSVTLRASGERKLYSKNVTVPVDG